MTRIRWGMVGGGLGSFIGESHRMAARLDDRYELVAGALSSDAARGKLSAQHLGIDGSRTYDDYRVMAREESKRPDGIQAVTVVTPNSSHHAIAACFLDAGINVICDKPLAVSVAEGADLRERARKAKRLLGVTYNYSGYPMIRQARALVAEGAIGKVRQVVGEFALGWLSVALEKEGVKQAWRTDPALAGPSGVTGDLGTHIYHLSRYVTGLDVESLAADINTFVPDRRLEDNAVVLLRYKGGARGTLWASMVAAGETVGLRLRVYGETGHLSWDQAYPDDLTFKTIEGDHRTLHRGGKVAALAKASTRLVTALPEGFIEAFANLYRDYAERIDAIANGRSPDPMTLSAPDVIDGLDGLVFVEAVLRSAASGGSWTPFV